MVATASDEDYRAAIEELVDVDQLLTYWAIEALTETATASCTTSALRACFPDGHPPAGQPWSIPNNFYAYHDPATGRFVFLPHGADIALGTEGVDHLRRRTLDTGPHRAQGRRHRRRETVGRPAFRDELADRMRWVLDEIWDVQALTARADVRGLVRADGLSGSRRPSR